MITRNKFHLLAVFFMSVSSGQTTKPIAVHSPLGWLVITPSNNPLLACSIDETVAAGVLDAIRPVLPYSVVVMNQGTVALSGIGIRFLLNVHGKSISRDFFYHSFGQPGRPVLPPGQCRVFTPLKTANALIAGATKAQGQGGMGPLSRPNELSAMQDLAAADGIDVSIDLAVADDGRYAGPDRASTVKRLNCQVDAFRAMQVECLARLKRGDSDQSISQWLEAVSGQMVIVDNQGGSHRYAASQKQYATSWLAYMKGGKRSELHTLLANKKAETLFPSIISLKRGLN